MQELIKCPLKVWKEGHDPLSTGEEAGPRGMSVLRKLSTTEQNGCPQSQAPICGASAGCPLLLGSTSPEQVCLSCCCFQGSLWPVHVISSQPEQTSFVLKNACLPVTAEAVFAESLMKMMMENSSMVLGHH